MASFDFSGIDSNVICSGNYDSTTGRATITFKAKTGYCLLVCNSLKETPVTITWNDSQTTVTKNFYPMKSDVDENGVVTVTFVDRYLNGTVIVKGDIVYPVTFTNTCKGVDVNKSWVILEGKYAFYVYLYVGDNATIGDNTFTFTSLRYPSSSENVNTKKVSQFTKSGNYIYYYYGLGNYLMPNTAATLEGTITNGTFDDTVTVETSFDNVTAADLPTEVERGGTLTIDLTPSSGYYLTTVAITYFDTDGYIITDELEITDTAHLTTTYTLKDDVCDTITIVASAAQKGQTEIVNNISDTTYTVTKLTDNTYYIQLSANEGYSITSATATYVNVSGIEIEDSFDVSKSPATCTVTTEGDKIILNGSTEIIPSGDIRIETSFENVTASDLPTTVERGGTLALDLTPTSGYYLTSAKVTYYNTSGYIIVDELEITDTAHLTTTYTLNDDVDLIITVVASAAQKADPLTPYGTLHGYCVDGDIMNSFAKARFFVENIGTGESPSYEQIDLGAFVVSLRRLHFDVPTGTSETVYCGKYGIKVSAPVLSKATVTHDFGTITIPEVAGNSHDETNEYTLYLPFVGNQTINGKYFGQRLSVQYTVSCITGKGFATVTIGDGATSYYDCDVSTSVYYQLSTDKRADTIGDNSFTVESLKELAPYLTTHYTVSLPSPHNKDNTTVLIGDCNGYSRFTDIVWKDCSQLTPDDVDEITGILESGIIL